MLLVLEMCLSQSGHLLRSHTNSVPPKTIGPKSCKDHMNGIFLSVFLTIYMRMIRGINMLYIIVWQWLFCINQHLIQVNYLFLLRLRSCSPTVHAILILWHPYQYIYHQCVTCTLLSPRVKYEVCFLTSICHQTSYTCASVAVVLYAVAC